MWKLMVFHIWLQTFEKAPKSPFFLKNCVQCPSVHPSIHPPVPSEVQTWPLRLISGLWGPKDRPTDRSTNHKFFKKFFIFFYIFFIFLLFFGLLSLDRPTDRRANLKKKNLYFFLIPNILTWNSRIWNFRCSVSFILLQSVVSMEITNTRWPFCSGEKKTNDHAIRHIRLVTVDDDDGNNQGRRQRVTTKNFSRGPQPQGGPWGPIGAFMRKFFLGLK